MVCMHNIGMAGLISDDNYALWVAMHETRPGASYELMLLDCTLFSDLKATQSSQIRRRQPDRDAADSGCAVERQRPELAQNNRGRLQDDTVAAIDRELVKKLACVIVTLHAPLLI